MANREVQRVGRLLDIATSKVARRLILEINAELVEATPVDSGWARSNWVPSIKNPIESVFGSPDALDNSARSRGEAAIVIGYDLKDGPAWITNNVPYIVQLNGGSSNQAAEGFVQSAIEFGIVAASSQRL